MEIPTGENGHKEKSRRRSKGAWLVLIGAPIGAFLGAAYVFLIDPTRAPTLFPSCFFYDTTGLFCPGCGDTRSLHALLHFRFLDALNQNMLFPFVLLVMAWLLAGEYLNVLLGRRVLWLPKKVPIWMIAVLVVVVILFSVLRNIPAMPFSWMAPGL